MSTLKKIAWFLLFVGALILVGIYTNNGQIIKIQNFVSLGFIKGGLAFTSFVLLLESVYKKDQKDLTPVQNKWRKFRLTACGGVLLLLFSLSFVQSPAVPVSIELKGVAKTSDLMKVQRDIHGVFKQNEEIFNQQSNAKVEQEITKKEFSKTFLDLKNQANDYAADNQARQQLIIGFVQGVDTSLLNFKNKQESTNESFLDQFNDLSKKLVDLDTANRQRDKVLRENLSGISDKLEKVSSEIVGLSSVDKKSDKPFAASIGNFSWNGWLSLLVLLALLSFGLSFFFKDWNKISVNTRRYYIPVFIVIIIFLSSQTNYLDKILSFKSKKEEPIVKVEPAKEKKEEKSEPITIPEPIKKIDTVVVVAPDPVVEQTEEKEPDVPAVETKKKSNKREAIYKSPKKICVYKPPNKF
jgi:hypothetical protein